MSFKSSGIQHRANNWQVAASAGAASQFIELFARAEVVGTDFFDWRFAIGIDGTTVFTPKGIFSNNGAFAVLTKTGAETTVTVRKQNVSWFGNFTPNDFLVDTDSLGIGDLKIVFADAAVSAVGANIEIRLFGGFNGVVRVYDAVDTLLASYTLAGVSAFSNDGSAIFLGIKSLIGPVIWRVDFTIDPVERFAINRVDFS